MFNKLAMFCMSTLLAVLAFAQGPGTPPDPQTLIAMRVSFLATALSLTDAQKASATTIFTNAYTDSESARSGLQTSHHSLSDAVKKNDIAAIETLASTIGALTGQLAAIEGKADAAFYLILTTEQQTKYNSLPHGGPGGFGGPGPGGFGQHPWGPGGR